MGRWSRKIESRAPLSLEPLEPRLPLDGTVLAAVQGGTLLIYGDLLDNGIRVEPGRSPGAYVITGLDTEGPIGPRPTYVNWRSQPLEVRGVTNGIRATMGFGDDRLEFRGDLPNGAARPKKEGGGMVVPGNVRAFMGRGDDTVRVMATDIGGTFRLKTAGGDDRIQIGPPGCGACCAPAADTWPAPDDTKGLTAKQAIMVSGPGDDRIEIANSSLRRKLSISTGSGKDLVSVSATQVAGLFKLMAGSGNDVISLGPRGFYVCALPLPPEHDFAAPAGISDGLQVRTALICAGRGEDKIGVVGSQFDHRLSIFAGRDDDFVAIFGTELGGDCLVRTDGGNDQVLIQCAPVFGAQFGVYGGKVAVDTGSGDDKLVLADSDVSRTVLRGGSGSERFDIDNCVVDSLFADLGRGDDALNIEQSPYDCAPAVGGFLETNVNGPVRLMMDDGDDVVRIGVDGAPNRTATFNDTLFADGGAGFDEFGFAPDNSERVPHQETRFEKDWPPPTLDAGNLYLTDIKQGVFKVDPITGDRVLISGPNVGAGPAFGSPTGIATDADGHIFVTDTEANAVFRVDPATGDRTIVSSNTVGSGPLFDFPHGIVVEASRDVLVTDMTLDAILRVDPTTGNRTVVSGDPDGANVGTGVSFSQPRDIGIEAGGTFVVIDSFADALFRVDPATGNRTIVSSDSVGSGNKFSSPRGLAVVPSGNILVADAIVHTVFRVNPANGDRGTIASNNWGSGPELTYLFGIVMDAGGDALVVNSLTDISLLRVETTTGNRTVASSESVGSGVDFVYPVYLAFG